MSALNSSEKKVENRNREKKGLELTFISVNGCFCRKFAEKARFCCIDVF